MSPKSTMGQRCISAGMFQAASSAAGGHGGFRSHSTSPRGHRMGDICIQLSFAKTTFLPLTPFFPCCKSMLGSRLPENVCEHPTHCCCFRSPFCSTCLLGTVAHHFIVRAQLTSTISLQESFNSYYYKNRDKFLSLLQSMNCRYIYGWFDPGYKPTTALCLYPPHSMQFGKICLERIRKRSAAAGPPKPTSQLVCLFVCLICSMLLTPLSFCWAEFASQSTP